MRRFIQVVVFLWVAVSVCGCSGKKDGADEAAVRVVIGGSISGGDGRMLYLHHLAVDTTGVGGADYIGLSNNAVADGKFILSCQPVNGEPTFYRVGFSAQNSIVTLARSGEQLDFHFQHPDTLCRDYTVSGGRDAELMADLDRQLRLFADSAEQLTLWYEFSDDDSAHTIINDAYNLIKRHHTNYLRNFIAQNSTSLATITAFYQQYQMATFFDEANDLVMLEKIYKNLKKQYPKNENVLWLARRIQFIKEKMNQEPMAATNH